MAFNGSGTFSLVAGNPVVTGTVISSTWANNTLQDISANGLSKCITIDGQSTTTSSVPFAAGISVTTGITTPSITVALFNTTATTVNAFGAATAVNMGAATGTMTLNNASIALAHVPGLAANLSLFQNAGNTALEFASGKKIGTTTRDLTSASGTQAITGVGFKPSLVQFFVAGGSTLVGEGSWGVDDGTTAKAVLGNYAAAGTFAFDNSFSISIIESGAALQQAKITALGADGFTLTWTKTGSPSASTANIIYVAFR